MWLYTSVRSTICIQRSFSILNFLNCYVSLCHSTPHIMRIFFIYLTTFHYITVCKNGDKKRVLTKLIARTRFSDFDYLFSEKNVNLV